LISEKNNQNFKVKIQDEALLVVLEVERHSIVLFHALIEGYDGLATVKTIDEANGVIAIIITPDFKSVVFDFLESVREELPWRSYDQEIETEKLFEYREV
jgi:hypothetical protein